jgi:5'-nucleotidase
MKLLLTNDDGIDAPGLAALFEASRLLGDAVVVAPAHAHSGCSHRVTSDGPIRIEERSANHFAIHGTPADCVRVALHRLAPDAACVLAGINAGGNLGADVYVSGTVAAAREAVLHGRPAIALSHYRKRDLPEDWQRVTLWSEMLLRDLLAQPWTRGSFWNVNLPHLPPDAPFPDVVYCPLDPLPLPLSFREVAGNLHYDGDYHGRPRQPGADVDVCFGGKIAVTKIALM